MSVWTKEEVEHWKAAITDNSFTSLANSHEKLRAKLAAANAVVEAARGLRDFLKRHGADMRAEGAVMDLDIYQEHLQNVDNTLDKLQGGDGE